VISLYEQPVRKIICEVLKLDTCDDITEKDDLQYVGMDSLNCMYLVVALEEKFNMEIPEEKLGLRFVQNIYDICRLVEEIKNDERSVALDLKIHHFN